MYKIAIAIEKVENEKPVRGLPPQIVENAVRDVTLIAANAVEDELNRALTGIGVAIASDLTDVGRANREFFVQFPDQRLLRGLSWLHLPARKFPFERMGLLGRPLSDQDLSIALQNCSHHLNHAVILEHGCIQTA